jgi:hypothetical protein
MDESGDLGFDFSKKKTSKVFIITCLFVSQKRPVEKIVKKTFHGFTKVQQKHHPGILHANSDTPKTRTKVLTALSEKDVTILVIYLNKQKVYTRLRDEKHVLYNYVTNILIDRICTKKLVPIDENIHLIASRRETNKFLNNNFQNYLENQISTNHRLPITVEIDNPANEKCLQIVDFASWAIYRKREHNDEQYYNIIKKLIIEENPLFP